MELKATLEKPYTVQQRTEFIIHQNHQQGYKIKETETALEAWGYTEEEKEEQRQERFRKEFFNTSLGWVSRKVHMKDGSIKDFLSDILPILEENAPIITYNIDGTQNIDVMVTEQFLGECKKQVLIDFYGAMQNEST